MLHANSTTESPAHLSWSPEGGRSPVNAVLERLDAVSRCRNGWIGRCPAHDDGRPSLKVSEGDDRRALLHCFAGCETRAILDAMGLTSADLFAREGRTAGPTAPSTTTGRITYDFHDASGTVVFQEVRDPPKRFWLRRPDAQGGWINDLVGVVPPLYALPELLADPERWVALTEGAKDADRLRSLGLLATTAAKGANAPWLDTYSETLRGRKVTIFADNDPPGIACAEKRARALFGTVERIKVVVLAGLPPKGDVSDWLDQGHTKEELLRILEETPDWSPGSPADAESHGSLSSGGVRRRPIVRSLATVTPQAVEFLWQPWLARGKLHLFGGHPGDGKSTLTLAIAAALTTGGGLPDGSRAPLTNVLLVLAEDDLADTVRPRLDLHGGDASRVFSMEGIRDSDGRDRALSLAVHVDEMRQVIEAHDIGLVIIDPITSYLQKADRNNEGDVRDTLLPFIKLIEATRVAAIGIMHVGKSAGQHRRPLQQLLGSTAFGAIARVVWMTGDLPGNAQPEPGKDGVRVTRKLLGVVKSNIAVRPPTLEWSRSLDGPIQWHGASRHSIDEALRDTADRPIDVAMAFLTRFLERGGKSPEDVRKSADAAGLSWASVRRAKDRLGIVSTPGKSSRGTVQGWVWSLPPESPGAQGSLDTQSEHVAAGEMNQPGAHDETNEHLEEWAEVTPGAQHSPSAVVDSRTTVSKPDAHFSVYGHHEHLASQYAHAIDADAARDDRSGDLTGERTELTEWEVFG